MATISQYMWEKHVPNKKIHARIHTPEVQCIVLISLVVVQIQLRLIITHVYVPYVA